MPITGYMNDSRQILFFYCCTTKRVSKLLVELICFYGVFGLMYLYIFLIATLWWLHCSALVSAAPLQHKDSGFKPGSLLKCACSVCALVFRRVVWFPPTVPFTCRLISDSTLVIDADVLSMKWLMCIEGVSASEWLNVTGSVQCIKWSLRLEKSSYINDSPFPLVLSLSLSLSLTHTQI